MFSTYLPVSVPKFHRWTLLIVVLLTFLISHGKGADLQVYLSPTGDDRNPGTKESPKKTVKHILKGIEEARNLGLTDQPITIWFRGGTYQLDRSIHLPSSSSGTEKAPIIFRGVEGEKAILTTGSILPTNGFLDASETSLADLLPSQSLENVKVLKIEDPDQQRRLSGDNAKIGWNGHLLQKSRWPNRGYSHIASVSNKGPFTRQGATPPQYSIDNPSGAVFTSTESIDLDALQRCLTRHGNIEVEGYFHNDWFFENIPLGSASDKKIQLLHHSRYGVDDEHIKNIPRRFRILNALSQLDEKGEWYYDQEENLLAIWPVKPMTAEDSFTVLGGPPIFQISNAEHIHLQNLIFEGGGKLGINISGGNNVIIAGCLVQNFIGRGIEISGGKNHLITGSTFRGMHNAMAVRGGDRRTLESCNHEVTNCEFSDLELRGYGAVGLTGVGIRFANNLMHNMNGSLKYSGNNITIELNEFYNMGWEMGDWNAIYTGADWAGAGNIVRHNFAHHMLELPGAYPLGAVRNDDFGMGTQYIGNVFYKTGRYGISCSGAANDLIDNICLETKSLWYTNAETKNAQELQEKWDTIAKFESGELKRGDKGDYLWRAEKIYGKEGYKKGIWLERFPILEKVMETRNGWSNAHGVVKGNYSQNVEDYVHGGSLKDLAKTLDYQKNQQISESKVFENTRAMTFKEAPIQLKKMSSPLPLSKIGLHLDPYRKTMPSKSEYRSAIKKLHSKTPSTGGTYDIRKIKDRYPLPSYLRKE